MSTIQPLPRQSAGPPRRVRSGNYVTCSNCGVAAIKCLCWTSPPMMTRWSEQLRQAACYVRARQKFGELGRPSNSIPCALGGI